MREAGGEPDSPHGPLNRRLAGAGASEPPLASRRGRGAIPGGRVPPPLFESMEIVGKPLTIARLKGLREHL